MKITPREKRRHIFLSPRRVSTFLAWGDFHVRSRFPRSTVPEEKWGTTRSLEIVVYKYSAQLKCSLFFPGFWKWMPPKKKKELVRFRPRLQHERRRQNRFGKCGLRN